MQAEKKDPEQGTVADVLPPFDANTTADVAVVGCGPAGLKLAAELAKLGLSVALVGRDAPFVNNYGVWIDEYAALGMESTLDARECRPGLLVKPACLQPWALSPAQ
jgi:lycopene epsilon-cyclase